MSGSDARRAFDTSRTRGLPQPLHLFAHAASHGHYHMGLFESASTDLEPALESLSRLVVGLLPAGGSVLDVGCGMGGTSRALADAGHPTLGIDPCEPAIAYATAEHLPRPDLRLQASSWQAFRRSAHGATFRHMVLVEVLQHVAPLGAFLRSALALLQRNATLVIADVVTIPSLPWDRVPFHQRGVIQAEAVQAGLSVRETRDLTAEVMPTFAAMRQHCAHLVHQPPPGLSGRPLSQEVRELTDQCDALEVGLGAGDLAYEIIVLVRN